MVGEFIEELMHTILSLPLDFTRRNSHTCVLHAAGNLLTSPIFIATRGFTLGRDLINVQ